MLFQRLHATGETPREGVIFYNASGKYTVYWPRERAGHGLSLRIARLIGPHSSVYRAKNASPR